MAAIDPSSATVRARLGGVTVVDWQCTRGPRDPVAPEVHGRACLSVVRRGRFVYHRDGRDHVMTPGAILLGDRGDEYACSHDHGIGDHCLSFHLDDDFLDAAGGRLGAPAIPPLARTAAIAALAAAALDGDSSIGLDEIACALASLAHAELGRRVARAVAPRPVDRRRALGAIDLIEARADDGELDLATLAAGAGLSPFHFLRLFRREVGVTPHQYLVRVRLMRAVALLVDTARPVTEICYAVGFADLSNFVRTFHREVGCAPGALRGEGRRKILQVASARLR